jgi:alpha-mannosidase
MPDFLPYTRTNTEVALSMIEQSIYTIIAPLEITAYRTREPVPFMQRTTGEEIHPEIGEAWGRLFDCAWFHFTGRVPAEAAGQAVVLLLDVNGEMLVVDAQGKPVRGLTNTASTYDFSLGKPGKRVLPLFNPSLGGEGVDVWADAGCNDLFGNVQQNGVIKEAYIATCNEEVRDLFYDVEVLYDFLNVIPQNSPRHPQVLKALHDAVWQLSTGLNSQTARAAREILRPVLEKRGGDPALKVTAIGHAHMDLGWLWPVRETHRKGARTFATALANIDRFPNYIFGASQPQLFQWMKDDYPELYTRIKQAVADGRIEAQGAMWVEADTNVPGGESLVRQVLHGKRFFRQEFGVDPDYLWLPDVFGYSAALPQILKLAGVRYFMTQKMSWSLINKFPHHSFHWRGLDGSHVLAHMLPEETYNSPALPRAAAKIAANYFEKGISDQSLMLFGIGDGGGGPGEEHLERIERIRDLNGLPPVRQGKAADFFPVWAKDAIHFPTWVGELYLERHQGTLTTEARNKSFNRQVEKALRELEWTASFSGLDYPKARLEAIWREVLLYQFHDILPGSSIKRVYDESLARYHAMLDEIETQICQHQEAIAARVNTSGMSAPLVVFNSLSWTRKTWLAHDGRWHPVIVPPMGWAAVDMDKKVSAFAAPSASPDLLENDVLTVRFDEDGSILSIFDKEAGREVLPADARANRFAVFTDLGDAWDFPMDYASQAPLTPQLVSSEAWVDGPRAVLHQVYQIGRSEITQEIRLEAGSRVLAFNTHLNWLEPRTMLRVRFPVAIHAEDAACEIQFGHIKRPTHSNTTWDLAKDEVTGHKWIDLSQSDYGVALLNDSKYGHRVKDSVLDLNLLRSVPYPGENHALDQQFAPGQPHDGFTDQGEHDFRYALYPHAGSLVAGDVVRAGYEFNYPLQVVAVDPHPGPLPFEHAFLTVDAPNIVIETVKQAEDGKDLILRLYETHRASARAAIRFGFPVQSVEEVNLMEESGTPLPIQDNILVLPFRPFEIKTLKIQSSLF